jgi:hypothetical protein
MSLVLLAVESQVGRKLPRIDILELLHQSIDVVMQVSTLEGRRAFSDIWVVPFGGDASQGASPVCPTSAIDPIFPVCVK